jgi:hypothetical protein
MLLHMNGKFTMGNWNHFFCRKVSFLTAPFCQFRGVGQGMKQIYLYLWNVLWNWYHQHARFFDWQHICYLWWTCFSTDSRHAYGYKLCSSSLKLKDRAIASFFSFFLRSPRMKSASYEWRNKSARRGAHVVPIGMPTVCWKTRPLNIANMLSIKHSSMLRISVSENPLVESECLYSYEADFIQRLLKKNEEKLARFFNFTFRYIDDVLLLNNYRFGDFVDRIYPIKHVH